MLVTFLVIVVSFDAKEGVAGVLEVLLNSFTSNSHSNFWSKIKDPPVHKGLITTAVTILVTTLLL